MRRKVSSKILSVVLVVASFVAIFPMTAKAVTPSTKEYIVSMKDCRDVFIGNETPVALDKGKEIYFVYTVKSVDKDATTSYQHGVAASDNITEQYPYEEGGLLQYSNDYGLLEVGSTYFLKFYMTEDGMKCIAVRAKGEEREVVNLPEIYGDATDKYKYVGLWFGCGSVTAEFSHVLCYDEDGNDLGVYSTAATIPPAEAFQYDTQLQQAYDVSATNAMNVGIYNAKKSDSKAIYFEYTVESSESMLYQTGAFCSTKPKQHYPHDNGFLAYESFLDNLGNGYLLEPGASYIVKIIKEEHSLITQVQKTVDGEYEVYSFPNMFGTYEKEAPYAGLWFGEGINYPVTFHLINMKCYDEEGNSLGIVCNQGAVDILQKGEKVDYTGVGNTYYNAETNIMIQLFDDKTAKVTREGKTEEITYEIWENTIHLNFKDGRESYVYTYQRIYSDKIAYDRLNTYYIEFKTDTDETIAIQKIDKDTNYIATKPEEPSKEGATFEGWVLSDGTEYDFDKVVSTSMTLYAKWSDEIEYQKITTEEAGDMEPIIAVVCSTILLVAAIAVSIVLVRRGGKKSENKKEKDNR